jgi:hypothetical protein
VKRAVAALAVAAALAGALLAVTLLDDETPERRERSTVREPELRPPDRADLSLTRNLPPGYERACQRLAEYAPREIAACPPVIPRGPLKVDIAAPFSGTRRDRDWFVMSFASCSLNTYMGRSIETNGCHWAYELAWSRRTRRIVVQRVIQGSGNPANPRSACRWGALAKQRVRACRVPSFERGGGFHGGHIAYLWERAPAAIVLSAHGYLNEARVKAMMTALIEKALRWGAGMRRNTR